MHPAGAVKAVIALIGDGLVLTPDRITGEVFELQDQMAMMVNAVRNGGELHATGDDGRWSVAMCIAAQESGDTGVPAKIMEQLS